MAGSPRVAVTRVYYATFHAARALLYSIDLEPKAHRGTLDLLRRHFVQTGKIDQETSRRISSLQQFREEADYGTALVMDETAVRSDLDLAREFVTRARELI